MHLCCRRCYVQSLSERDLDRRGWQISKAPAERNVINFVRGRRLEAPLGGHPGFANNVGVVGLQLPGARPWFQAQDGSWPAIGTTPIEFIIRAEDSLQK